MNSLEHAFLEGFVSSVLVFIFVNILVIVYFGFYHVHLDVGPDVDSSSFLVILLGVELRLECSCECFIVLHCDMICLGRDVVLCEFMMLCEYSVIICGVRALTDDDIVTTFGQDKARLAAMREIRKAQC